MPFKSERIKISNTMLDRRRKLTDEQKEQIREIYESGVCGTRPLAKQFGVSRSLIQVIVNPDIAKKRSDYIKANWKKYQANGEEWNAIMREHRRYKQDLFIEGKIKEKQNETNS